MDIEHVNKEQNFGKLSKEVKDAYQKWRAAVFDEKGSPIEMKTMELIALAASAAIRCEYCIESHSFKAKKAGATQEEMAKAIQIASVVEAGSTISYGVEALDSDKKK